MSNDTVSLDELILHNTTGKPIAPRRARKADGPSFSGLVIEKNRVVTKCNMGHTHAVYRRSLRPCFVVALRALAERGPMSTTELFKLFSHTARLADAIKSHFAEAQLWGFIERDGDGRWKPTGKAGAFLDGRIRVYRHVWPRGQELPAECQDSDLVYVHDIVGEDFTRKVRHSDNAVTASSPLTLAD